MRRWTQAFFRMGWRLAVCGAVAVVTFIMLPPFGADGLSERGFRDTSMMAKQSRSALMNF